MDLVELLMVEHSSIRLLARCNSCIREMDNFVTFHKFIARCHARVEDEFVFPVLKKHFEGVDKDFVMLVQRISSDHKLLDKLAGRIVEYGRSGNWKTYENRLGVYFRLLTYHNSWEEKALFPRWLKDISQDTRDEVIEQAKKIIMRFGLDKYTEITGLSEEAFKLI